MHCDLPMHFPTLFASTKRSLFCLLILFNSAAAQEPEDEFFETKIRPLLVEHCYSCHSEKSEKLQAGLYLDRADGLIQGGESGPAVVPGKPDESLLVRAVRYEENEMPPDGKLSDAEIAALTKWVELGAKWPADQTNLKITNETGYDWNYFRNEHWSLQPITSPIPPTIQDTNWPRNEIDQFVLSALESAKLQPAKSASAQILARRIYLDLIGIPPSPNEVDEFVSAATEDRQQAVAALIDNLLASPHYGERWGRHWLDVARYSDGYGGFLDNRANQHAWRYRDWVVKAFNNDQPYDQFVKAQIAGDLLGTRSDAIGTGFFALGPNYQSDGGDPDSVAQAKSETLDDRMDTLSRGFLALTVSCARCHDHKFDPIPQIDYYSLAGIFHNSGVRETPLVSDDIVKAYNDRQNEIKQREKQINELPKKAKQENRELSKSEQTQLEKWKVELDELRKSAPPKYPSAHALHDKGSGNLHVALRGNSRKPGEEAPRRFLEILSATERSPYSEGSGRIELANSIANASNPLTARVIVNRIWLQHFGRALVRSPSNFGSLGETPTHPLLLDWLAANFIESGWSIKTLHRQIMTSSTYQMSSQMNSDNFARDGDNRLIWRMNPRRMDVEAWRDSLLAVTGELDLTIGGPPLDNLSSTRRRTLYAKVSRNGDVFESDRFLRLFDFPLMRATVAQRPSSIVPQQFLFLMNSRFMVDRAEALATKLETAATNDDQRIELAYRLLFGRFPRADELELGRQFISESSTVENSNENGDKLARFVQYAQVLLSSNEFMYVR